MLKTIILFIINSKFLTNRDFHKLNYLKCKRYNCEYIYIHCRWYLYNDFSLLLKNSDSIHDILNVIFESLKSKLTEIYDEYTSG